MNVLPHPNYKLRRFPEHVFGIVSAVPRECTRCSNKAYSMERELFTFPIAFAPELQLLNVFLGGCENVCQYFWAQSAGTS